MSVKTNELWMQEAFLENIPAAAVYLKCRNWGIVTAKAIDLAEECAAEAYRRSIGRHYSDASHYRAWLTRTAVNVAVDLLREQSRTIPLDSAELPHSGLRESIHRTEDIAEGMQTLAPQERLIVDLTFDENLTLDEIAAQLYPGDQGSSNAKRLRIKRLRDLALHKLRVFLSEIRRAPASQRNQTMSLT